MSDLVGNPEDRFSQNEAQIVMVSHLSSFVRHYCCMDTYFLLMHCSRIAVVHVHVLFLYHMDLASDDSTVLSILSGLESRSLGLNTLGTT